MSGGGGRRPTKDSSGGGDECDDERQLQQAWFGFWSEKNEIRESDQPTREVVLELKPIGVGQLGSEVIGTHLNAMEAQGDIVIDSTWVDQINLLVVQTTVTQQLIEGQSSKLVRSQSKEILNLENDLNFENPKIKESNLREEGENFGKSPANKSGDQPGDKSENQGSDNDSSHPISDPLKDFPLQLV